jgi:Phage integrase, N-terminal SAM-like domain
MGQIRKRGGVYWIRYYRNGRRFEESARTDKWETARDLLRTKEGAIANGAAMTSKIGRLRFEDAAADLETDYSINNRSSLDHIQRHVKRLTAYFGGHRMTDITGADVRRYIALRQKDGMKNSSINRELAALGRMFTLAVDAGKLLAKPKIPMLQENNVRRGFFETAQFLDVREGLTPMLQDLATLAFYTGWRRGELIGEARTIRERATRGEWKKRPLEWSRVDRHACVIRLDVGTTKNKDGREFHYGALRTSSR